MNGELHCKSDDQRELAEQELLLQVNQLLQDASTAYWEWNLAFQKTLLLEEAVQLAADRLDAVRISAVLGRQAIN